MIFENQTFNLFDNASVSIPNMMRTDIQERDGNYLLEIEIPGFSREDVTAELVDGTLTIIASKPETLEKDDTKINYILKERLATSCRRSFFVGTKIKQEDITAAYKDGILSIIITNPQKSVDRDDIKLIPIQ
ncbi:MAG: Hsp20/alpha crystallin family protein [Lachnospiraceae bacterium]|nr:Hsp20/alpha crystallin family protein [Lachnospiraceae bacterium]